MPVSRQISQLIREAEVFIHSASLPASRETNESSSSSSFSLESIDDAPLQNSNTDSQTESSSHSPANSNFADDNYPISSIWPMTLVAFAGSIFTLCFNFIIFTFKNNIPTKQLHAISIVILTVHMLVQKVLDTLPNMLLRLFYALGGDTSFLEANNIEIKSMWLNTEFAALEQILEKIITDGLSVAAGGGYPSSEQVLTFMDTPLTTIMLPTTIISVFLLMTVTTFLIFHVAFQGFMLVSSWGNPDGSVSNSPIIMACIMFLLLLENVLPWIFFATGFYLSFSIGGMVWFFFLASTYLLWLVLKGLRSLVFQRFQDGRIVF
eukprot:scaffold10546_cov266-Chaetoceros_neogracile.AAC.8